MKTREEINAKFWKKNVHLIAGLLAVWFTVSFGIVILLGDVLHNVPFFGTTLPFWFGQQGSIITFVGLVLVYAIKGDQYALEMSAEIANSKEDAPSFVNGKLQEEGI